MTHNIHDKFGIEVSTCFHILFLLELFFGRVAFLPTKKKGDSFFGEMLSSNAMIFHMSTELPL